MRREDDGERELEALIDAIDLDASSSEFAEAEALLRYASAEVVSQEWIAAAVRRATARPAATGANAASFGTAAATATSAAAAMAAAMAATVGTPASRGVSLPAGVQLTPAPRRRSSPLRLLCRRPLAAALLLVLVACTAGVTVARLWGGQRSSWTLPQPLAVEILASRQQADTDKRSALSVLAMRLEYGIRSLETLASRADTPAELGAAATARLRELAQQLRRGAGAMPANDGGALEELGEALMDRRTSVFQRTRVLRRFVDLLTIDLRAIQRTAGSPRVERTRRFYLDRLANLLDDY